MRFIAFFSLAHTAVVARTDVIALDCIIDLPDCYVLDTRDGLYSFKCFENPEDFGVVTVRRVGSDFPDSLEHVAEPLYQIDDLKAERLIFKGDFNSVEAISVKRGVGVVLFTGEATKLVPEVIDHCLNNPFP